MPIGEDGIIHADPPGECREHLHATALVQNSPRGPVVLGWVTGYPAIQASFHACGRFALPVVVLENAGV